MEKTHYTIAEVAKELGVPKHTLSRLATAGRFKSRKVADIPTAPRLISHAELMRMKRDGIGLNASHVNLKYRK
jgi:DNA-binding transcriptional MerR regulator